MPKRRFGRPSGARRAWSGCAALLVAACVSASALAAQLSVAWDASGSPAVTGYYLYYGVSSRSYPNRIAVGSGTSYTVTNLAAGQTYYFAVSAHDATLAESPLSNEISTTTPSLAASSTVLGSTANPSVVGSSVTLVASVTGNAPTGTVAFRDGGAAIAGCGAVALTGSGNTRTAACSTSSLAVGTRPITAAYGGNAGNAGSTSPVYSQFVHSTSQPSTFADVPADHWAASAVEALVLAGITQGCATAPRQFCPDGLVTRAEMAVFLERALRGVGFVFSPTGTRFADVPISHWAVGPIEQLYLDGITAGCAASPLRFCPGDAVTRASMAKLLLLAKYGVTYNPGTASGTVFADVPTTYWAAAWIEAFYGLGYTTGCGSAPMRFCPDALLTRAEMAVFLYRQFDLPDPP